MSVFTRVSTHSGHETLTTALIPIKHYTGLSSLGVLGVHFGRSVNPILTRGGQIMPT